MILVIFLRDVLTERGDSNLILCSRNEIYETYQDQSMKSELFISNTDRNDGAIYTCLAENEHGHDERTVKLLIIGL